MKAKISNGKNEKLIAAIAAVAVVSSMCAAVYFTGGNRGGSYDAAPDGIAFAAPDASDGHVQIDDGPVPMAGSYDESVIVSDEDVIVSDYNEIWEDNDVIVSDRSDYSDDSEIFLEDDIFSGSNDSHAINDEVIIDDPGSTRPSTSNSGSKDVIIDDSSNVTNSSAKENTNIKEEAKNTDKDKDKNKQKEDKASSSDAQSISVLDNLMLKNINELRASAGAGKLSVDEKLCEYAATRAKEASESWSHTRPDGSQGCDMISSSKYRAENLSRGTYSSFGYTQKEQEEVAVDMFANLKASSTHYDNMTYKNFTKVGISTYVSKTSDGKTRLTTAYMFSN